MAGDSPAVIVFDINGNPIGSVSDGVFYRLQTDTRITDGISTVGITDVLGQKALKVDVVKTVSSGGVGTGGTSSNYLDPFPVAGTAVGFSDGYYMQGATVFDLDSSINSQYILGVSLRTIGLGGSVDFGTLSNPIRIDPTGNTIQPVQETRSSTATETSVAASSTTVTILSSNASRLGATIWNDSSTATLYLKLGTTASTSSYTAQVFPSGYYEVPYGYTGEIDGIWSSAVGNARVTELT